MSLLEVNYEPFVILDKKTVDDPEGGYTTEYHDGVTIQAVAVKDETVQALIAGAQGVTAFYKITTNPQIVLRNMDVLRRERDGKTFRVRSDGDDKATPKGAGLKMRQVRAEEWVIPV